MWIQMDPNESLLNKCEPKVVERIDYMGLVWARIGEKCHLRDRHRGPSEQRSYIFSSVSHLTMCFLLVWAVMKALPGSTGSCVAPPTTRRARKRTESTKQNPFSPNLLVTSKPLSIQSSSQRGREPRVASDS